MEWLKYLVGPLANLLSSAIPWARWQRRVRSLEAKLSTFMCLVPGMYWETDAEGNNVWISPSFGEYLGVGQEGFAGFSWYYLIVAEDRDKVLADFQESRRLKIAYRGVFRMRGRHGKTLVIESVGYPVRDSSGNVIGWLGVARPGHKSKTK